MRALLIAAVLISGSAYAGEPTKTALLLCLGAPLDHYQDGEVEILTYRFATESRRVMIPVTIGSNTMMVAKDIQKTCDAIYTFRGGVSQGERLSGACDVLLPRCN